MLLEKRDKYLKLGGDKQKYMSEMFEVHKLLFDYSLLIKNSPLVKIEITEESVVFTIASCGKDIKICCDKRDAHSLPMSYLNFSKYEEAETSMILELIKPRDVVFDIGANIGWHTLNILLHVPGTKVYSFEPINVSYEYLLKNLKLNNQNTDNVFIFGFSDENKVVNFYFDTECNPASSMANLRESEYTVIQKCRVKKIDDFVKSKPDIRNIDFIKCDVEGAELLVFKGGLEIIKKYRPVIFSEMLRKWSKKFGYHPNDIIKLFLEIGYECYIINDRLVKFGYVEEDTLHTNYIFLHKEKHKSIASKLI